MKLHHLGLIGFIIGLIITLSPIELIVILKWYLIGVWLFSVGVTLTVEYTRKET